MLKSEAVELLRYWQDGDLKIYRYVREFVPAEFITFKKVKKTLIDEEATFETEIGKSTYNLGNFTYEEFLKKKTMGELVYEKDNTWATDTKKMKTDGCICGAWAIRGHSNLHDPRCPRWEKFRG